MERAEIEKILLENVCLVTFTKIDGTERKMKCTLQKDFLPDITERVVSKSEIARVTAMNVIQVFDVEKNDWRAFRIDSVKAFEVLP